MCMLNEESKCDNARQASVNQIGEKRIQGGIKYNSRRREREGEKREVVPTTRAAAAAAVPAGARNQNPPFARVNNKKEI